jgi:hypothetical protein
LPGLVKGRAEVASSDIAAPQGHLARPAFAADVERSAGTPL